MNILCIDTATLHESVALLSGGVLRAERTVHHTRGHGPGVLDDVQGVLDAAGLTIDDLDALICGLGPGSFTGLRIALATLKGLSLAKGIPLYGARTTALVRASVTAPRVFAVLDARRKEVFVEGPGIERPVVCSPEAAAALLAEGPAPVLVGSGALAYAEVFKAALPSCVIPADATLHLPRAALLAGLVDLSAPPPALATLEPMYVRKSDAEINYPDGFPDARGRRPV
jgi:tRNA threonylcarbamoyladenosine biosynthesis protein TsaB